MTAILGFICGVTLLLLLLLAAYQWVFAIAALLPSARTRRVSGQRSRIVVLIPAHDEESGLTATLESLRRADYPAGRLRVVVIADRCRDATAAIAMRSGVQCLERSEGEPGKGAAIAWAVEQCRRRGTPFDALLVVDADTVVDRDALLAFDDALRDGQEVQQGYNYLSNPWESPFTRIIAVTSVLRNELFYAGKERLGMTSMLSGTGMCFSRRIIERLGWSAFSVGEDWEFSVALLLAGERIHFNRHARVRAAESHGFRQASTQRLRWASGRHGVAAANTGKLISAGLRQRRLELWDAALTMFAPTYSSQGTLVIVSLAAAAYLRHDAMWSALLPLALGTAALLCGYFATGLMRTEAPMRALGGLLLVPAFLPWRASIELLGALGYGRTRWVRTSRMRMAARRAPAPLEDVR